MKLVYAVSQRDDPRRPAARHIDNGNGGPMCGGNGREPFFWASEEGDPTCKICKNLAAMDHGEGESNTPLTPH